MLGRSKCPSANPRQLKKGWFSLFVIPHRKQLRKLGVKVLCVGLHLSKEIQT
jgi:hypothetical protein